MLKRAVLVFCALWAVSSASADIEEWGGATGGYIIVQAEHTILITAAGTYKFESVTAGELDYIDWIRVEEGVMGTVNVHVSRDPAAGGGNGASNVKEVDLANAETGNLQEMLISGNYGELGPMLADNAGTLSIGGDLEKKIEISYDITGPLTIGGDVSVWGDITCGTMAGPVTIEGKLHGDITCYWLNGDLTVVAGTAPFWPDITIVYGYDHDLYVNGPLSLLSVGTDEQDESTGTLTVTGNLERLLLGLMWGEVSVGGWLGFADVDRLFGGSSITVDGDLWIEIFQFDKDAEVTVGGNLDVFCVYYAQDAYMKGKVDVTGDVRILESDWAPIEGTVHVRGKVTKWIHSVGGHGQPMSGDIHVEGDVEGEIRVGSDEYQNDLTGTITVGSKQVGGDLLGPIYIYGDVSDAGGIMINGSFAPGNLIFILGTLEPSTTFIALDYDGWDEDDVWGEGAAVQLYGPSEIYYGNTPAKHIWEIAGCRGELNNDFLANFDDINPFILALTDPVGYKEAFSGLDGSRVWHGDCNCNEEFGLDDINPFIQRITEGCCWEQCGDCPEKGGGRLPPEQLAAKLDQHIDPALREDLLDIIAKAAATLPDPKDRAYWAAVYAEMTK